MNTSASLSDTQEIINDSTDAHAPPPPPPPSTSVTPSQQIADLVSALQQTTTTTTTKNKTEPATIGVFYNALFKAHRTPIGHAESPERLDWVMHVVEQMRAQRPNQIQLRDDFSPLTIDHAAVLATHSAVYLQRMRRRVPDTEQPLHATWASFSMGSLGVPAILPRTGTVVLQLDRHHHSVPAPLRQSISESSTSSSLLLSPQPSISVLPSTVNTPTTIVLPSSVTASFAVQAPPVLQNGTRADVDDDHESDHDVVDANADVDSNTSLSSNRALLVASSQCASSAPLLDDDASSLTRQDTVTDTFMSRDSWNAALLSAGGVCAAIDAVLTGPIRKVFVPSRPPGHHAARHGRGEGATSQGFCLLNNIAIGAFHAQNAHQLERIVIFDTDVHSGNGTIDAVGGQPKMLFCQLLAPFDFLPDEGRLCSLFTNVVNVTLTSGATKQGEHLHCDLAPVWKRIREFRPQILLVSAGFDAHAADRLMNQAKGHLQDADFEILFRSLCEIADECCDGRLVAALEGGYTKRGLTGGVGGMLRAMIGVDEKSDRSARARTKRKTRH